MDELELDPAPVCPRIQCPKPITVHMPSLLSAMEPVMPRTETQTIAGRISLDENGERLFLVVQPGMHVRFGNGEVAGGQVVRVLEGDTRFAGEIFSNESRDVSIAARLATPEEVELHDQVTDPTLAAEKIVSFEAIQKRAYEIFRTGADSSADENWLRAEREILSL